MWHLKYCKEHVLSRPLKGRPSSVDRLKRLQGVRVHVHMSMHASTQETFLMLKLL